MDNTITRTMTGWLKECVVCLEEYESTREDSLTCSEVCRKRKQREEQKLINQRMNAKLEVSMIMSRISQGQGEKEDVETLRYIYKRLHHFLGAYGWLSEDDE